MKYLKKFEKLITVDNIFIDSDIINHDKNHQNIDDAYTGYEKTLKSFNYNNIKVDQAKGDVHGDDFKGFYADLEIRLTNGLHILWKHNNKGEGVFNVFTKMETEIFSEHFNLPEFELEYSNILISKIQKILNFNF